MRGNSSSFRNMVIAIIFILISGFLLYLAFNLKESTQNLSQIYTNISDPNVENKLNKYLKETNSKIELEKFKAKSENDFLIPKVGDLVPYEQDLKSSRIEMNTQDDQNIRRLRKDFQKNSDFTDESPSEILQRELAEKQELERQQEKEKEEYIKQFVENARRNGWKIVVDKNGMVKSAQPLQPNNSINIFDPSSSSAQ